MNTYITHPWQVPGLLDGSITEIRVPVDPQPKPFAGGVHPRNEVIHKAPYIDAHCGAEKTPENPRGMSNEWFWWTEDDRLGPLVATCPFGVPGDRLVVLEEWQEVTDVRCELLASIGWEDASKSGVEAWRGRDCPGCSKHWGCMVAHKPDEPCPTFVDGYMDTFRQQWNIDYPDHPWSPELYVFAATVRRIEQ